MAVARTGDQLLVREINLSIILNTLRTEGRLSRAALAALTGLNKTTVSSLVSELIDAHFIHELGLHGSNGGRPGMLLELNPDAGCIIAAEIGVEHISVLVTDFNAETLWRHQDTTSPEKDQKEILRAVAHLLRRAYAQAERTGTRILGMSLGVPGLVNVESGTLIFAPNLRWRDVPLKQLLQRKFDCPIYVNNEATMAALGESYFGIARNRYNVLYISSGVGLGGGLVLEGRILPGATGFAGEFGHMTIEREGPLCNCGNRGCWETLVSQSALFERVRAAIARGEPSRLSAFTNGHYDHLTVPVVVDAARDGDLVALQALHQIAEYLGIGIANLINAFNPEMVVFGGSLNLAGDFLMPVIERVIAERALRWSAGAARVVLARHGFDACLMGGIATVYHQVLSQPFQSVRTAMVA